MEGRRVILADGHVHEGCDCGCANGVLVIYLTDGTQFMDAAVEFTDPTKTAHIVYEYGDMTSEYDGFTVIRGVLIDADETTVMLKQGVQ